MGADELCIEDIARDIRHAWRLLRRTRGFTVTAIAVLAISIGANTAVFSVINSLLLRPLPYPEPDRIVQVVITHDPARISYTLEHVDSEVHGVEAERARSSATSPRTKRRTRA